VTPFAAMVTRVTIAALPRFTHAGSRALKPRGVPPMLGDISHPYGENPMNLAHFAPAHVLALAVALAAPACLGGCAIAADPASSDEEDVAAAQQADEDENGLTMNGLTMNGLTMNGLTMNGLTMNGLTMNGLTLTSGIVPTLTSDPLSQLFFKYIVSCALPADQAITVPGYGTFAGGLGLAPQWGVDGATCDGTCQQWVSACVISRVNALGVHVPLSERGATPALALGPTEATDYPNREATYWGNVFTVPQQRFACRAAGDDQTLIGRPCGNGADVSACIITVLGDCNTVCGVHDSATGYYGNCTAPGAGTFVPAVTVYRQ
jgi:hypothetical protein